MEQPKGMTTEDWIANLLEAAKDAANGIAVACYEEGEPNVGQAWDSVANDIETTIGELP